MRWLFTRVYACFCASEVSEVYRRQPFTVASIMSHGSNSSLLPKPTFRKCLLARRPTSEAKHRFRDRAMRPSTNVPTARRGPTRHKGWRCIVGRHMGAAIPGVPWLRNPFARIASDRSPPWKPRVGALSTMFVARPLIRHPTRPMVSAEALSLKHLLRCRRSYAFRHCTVHNSP